MIPEILDDNWLIPLIASLSTAMWAMILDRWLHFQKYNIPADRVASLPQGSRPGLLGTFADQFDRLRSDGRRIDEAYREARGNLELKLDRYLGAIGAITAILPLLGLLGTVNGMIEMLSGFSSASGQASVRISGGISHALLSTQAGLLTALPGVFFLQALRKRSNRIRHEVEIFLRIAGGRDNG